jgi:RNA polymerase sigma-70 factor, ECF subfamily
MDHELIQRARKGDRDAVGVLYQRHASRVYAIVRRLARDDEQAQDWAQEAWLRVFRALPGFREESQFTTWLHRVAVNTALQGHRVNQLYRSRFQETDTVPELPVESGQPILRMALERAIETLPAGMRRVLVLHDVEGYTHEEIAAMLGVTPGTCKSQLFKARARLREQLEPTANHEGETVCTT